ncbi:MAG TPA: DUF892 family protein [Flavobacterium sp.]|nr:DUF892 family protein [Flavobacterium sp.]
MKTLITSEKAIVKSSRISTAKTKSPEDIRSVFEEQLRQIYWCEKELAELLPSMAKLATSYELTTAILAHLAVTENQIIRLIHVFDVVGERVVGKKCVAIENIISANEDIQLVESGYFRDSEIITISQKIMHYEIAAYGLLHELAVKLGEDLAAEFLGTAIKEERNAHARLTEIRLSSIYFDAAS